MRTRGTRLLNGQPQPAAGLDLFGIFNFFLTRAGAMTKPQTHREERTTWGWGQVRLIGRASALALMREQASMWVTG